MLWKYTVKPYDRNICYRKNSGNQEHHLSFFRLNITNKSQTSLASWFMYTALQQTFQLLESSKISSLLTKQCCYQQEAYEPNLNSSLDFQDHCPILCLLASFDNVIYFLFSLFFWFVHPFLSTWISLSIMFSKKLPCFNLPSLMLFLSGGNSLCARKTF